MEFEWDDEKAEANIAKHLITFEAGVQALLDAALITRQDTRKNYGEERRVTIGVSSAGLLVVVHTERQGKIRLISARKANHREKRKYEAGARRS